MTAVNRIASDSTMMLVKESNVKVAKTDEFQSIMKNAQNLATKLEGREARPTAKEVIVKKLNSAKQGSPIKGELEVQLEQAEEIIGQLIIFIKQEVMDSVEITEEELANAMESLGLEDVDLLSSNNITDLTTYLMTGEKESFELLFNTEFLEKLKNVQSHVKELQTEVLTELNVSESEFTKLVNQILVDQEKSNEAILTKNPAEFIKQEFSDSNVEQKLMEERVEAKVIEKVNQPNQAVVTTEAKDMKQENLAGDKQNENMNQFSEIIPNVMSNLEVVVEKLTDEFEAVNIIKQITDKVSVHFKQGITSMEIQLNPEHLGKVNLEVIAKNGMITASITTESQMAKDAIESQMIILKENLMNQGIKVEEVEVTIAAHQFEHNLDGQKEREDERSAGQGKVKSSNLDLDLESLDSEEILEQSMMLLNGNSVNLTA